MWLLVCRWKRWSVQEWFEVEQMGPNDGQEEEDRVGFRAVEAEPWWMMVTGAPQWEDFRGESRARGLVCACRHLNRDVHH